MKRKEQDRNRQAIVHAVWSVTRKYWTAGGLPDKPEHVNWLAPLFDPGDWPAGARIPEKMRIPLPPSTRPNFDEYRKHLGVVLGLANRPQRLELIVMPDHVIVMPDRLEAKLLPAHAVYNDAPWRVPLGETRDRVLTWNPAGVFPHFLIAGLTGFGKTTLLNTLLLNLIRAREEGVPTRLYVADPKRFSLEAFRGYVDGFAPLPVADEIVRALVDGTIAPGWEAQIEQTKLQEIADVVRTVLQISISRQVRAGNRRGAARLIETEGRVFLMIDEAIALLQYESITGTSPAARAAQARDGIRKQIVADLGQMTFMGRELGIHVVVCTNRPDVTVLPGPVRAQLVGRLAFRLDAEGSRMVTNTDLAFTSLPLDVPGRYWLIDPHNTLGWEQGHGYDAPEAFVESELARVA